MKMNKREKISLSLAVILNLIIIILIPKYKIEDVLNKKLKVGLVAFEREKVSQKETKAQKKIEIEKGKEKKESVDEKNKKIKQKKEERIKKKNLALNAISKTIKTPEINRMKTIDKNIDRKVNDSILDSIKSVKKDIKFEREDKIGINTKNVEFNDKLKKEEIIKKNKTNESIFISEEKKDLNDSIKIEDMKIEGLPSGYKLGVEDGDIIARWDKNNKEPVYPESAELKGLQGTVRVKMDVNEHGEVISLVMIKGSGVPEINSAIESIGRTWKIYLSKHGLSIKGKVILDYTFKLKGGI